MAHQDNPEKNTPGEKQPASTPARVVPLGDEISGLQRRLDGLRRQTGQLSPDKLPENDKPQGDTPAKP